MRGFTLKAAVFAAVLFFAASWQPLAALSGNPDLGGRKKPAYVPGEVLIKYRSGSFATQNNLSASAMRVGVMSIRSFADSGIELLRLPPGVTVEQAVAEYSSDPNVLYAEPNYIRRAEVFPNDPLFDQLWGLHNNGQSIRGRGGSADADMDAPEAWDVITGSMSTIVAVVDTGVDYNHPDLKANIWTNPGEIPGNGIDDDENGHVDDIHGWDFSNGDNDPLDENGHGTHVAGTIAAVGNNGVGITGVSWTASIMALKILDAAGTGGIADEIAALEYAKKMGAHIINISFGGSVYSQAEADAIEASGILIVTSAGNDGVNTDNSPHYPSGYPLPNIISVTATDQDDNLTSFANFGPISVDLSAPGVSIYSTYTSWESVFSDSFDNGGFNGWSTGGENSLWGVTADRSYSPPLSLTDSPGVYYNLYTNTWAMSPALDLTGRKGCRLDYALMLDIEPGYDFLHVEASPDGYTWTNLYSYSGTSNGAFVPATEPLSVIDGSPSGRIRFRLESDFSFNYDGIYVDDVTVSCVSANYTGEEYHYLSGTSMATPHVSGLAALIKSINPALGTSGLKAAILNSVDPLPGLKEVTVSGGRANAQNVMPPAAPSSLTAAPESSSAIKLSWSDNSLNDSGFKIERDTSEGGTFTEVAAVEANVTGHIDRSLASGTTYFYRVKAFNPQGDSLYSNTALATTDVSTIGNGISNGVGNGIGNATAKGGGGGNCFIATAAFGSPLHPHVKTLRIFRDRHLLTNRPGRAFVRFYYRHSPLLAGLITRHAPLRALARASLYPLIFSVKYPYFSLAGLIAFALFGLPAALRVRRPGLHRQQRQGAARGFTFLELMVVVFILGLLTALVAPSFMRKAEDAKVADAKIQIKNFETALKLFKMDTGFYPSTEQGLEALIEKPTTGQIPENYKEGGYLEKNRIPLDPWKTLYIYVSPGLDGEFDILTLGADGQEGGDGNDADIHNRDTQ